MADPRQTRVWRSLRDQVVDEEPTCRLRLIGCTYWSTTGDHIVTVKARPDLALVRSNVRGSCESCNRIRGTQSLEAITHLELAPEPLSFFD